MNHMKQNEGGTIVKLYHPSTKEPVYIEVGNTYYCEGEDDSIKHGQPFIHMYEKAYAVLAAMHEEYKKNKRA